MKSFKIFILLFSFISTSSLLYGQTNLLQTFSEDFENSYSAFGTYVASAGDVNGDGFDDIVISGNDTQYIYSLEKKLLMIQPM